VLMLQERTSTSSFLFCSRGGMPGASVSGVDHPREIVDQTSFRRASHASVRATCRRFGHVARGGSFSIAGLPASVAFQQIAPRYAQAEHPEHAIKQRPFFNALAPHAPLGPFEVIRQEIPLLIGRLVPAYAALSVSVQWRAQGSDVSGCS
jgi:hypothetical protein